MATSSSSPKVWTSSGPSPVSCASRWPTSGAQRQTPEQSTTTRDCAIRGIPGVKWTGTFTRDGERHFWNVTGSALTIVVQLTDEDFDRLYLSVREPGATVDAINAAIAAA